MAVFCKVHRDGFDHRLFRVLEVDRHQPAAGTGALVHQAAGFAEVFVLGILRNFGDFRQRHVVAVVEAIEDAADEHLEAGRGGQPRTRQNVAGHKGLHAPDVVSVIHESLVHAFDQRLAGAFLRRVFFQIRDRERLNGERITHNLDHIVGFCCHANGIQVHARCKDTPVLVIGVVSRHLGPARRGEHRDLQVPEPLDEGRQGIDIAVALHVQYVFVSVEIQQQVITGPVFKFCLQFTGFHDLSRTGRTSIPSSFLLSLRLFSTVRSGC